jgi:hypothetical protein
MKRSLLFGLFAAIALALAWPYLGLVIFRMVGTETVIAYEADGTARSFVVGPDAPLPDWLPRMPRSLTLSAAHWLDGSGAGGHDVIAHASPDAIEKFYGDELSAAGFVMTTTPLRPEYAMLGIAGGVSGRRERDSLEINIIIRSRESFVSPARAVQINWGIRKTLATSA